MNFGVLQRRGLKASCSVAVVLALMALVVSLPEPNERALVEGYRLERFGFNETMTLPFLDVRTAAAAYRFLDFEGDRYESGSGGWTVVRRGAADPQLRWVVREEIHRKERDGRTISTKLRVEDRLYQRVMASRTLSRGQIEGAPPTGWTHGHAVSFVRRFLEPLSNDRQKVVRVPWPRANEFESLIGSVVDQELDRADESCNGIAKVVSRGMIGRVDVGSWELIPGEPAIKGISCGDGHVAAFSAIYSDVTVTFAADDGSFVASFVIGTSFDWTKSVRKFANLRVDQDFVRFEVQEWQKQRLPHAVERLPTRRLAYAVPRVAVGAIKQMQVDERASAPLPTSSQSNASAKALP